MEKVIDSNFYGEIHYFKGDHLCFIETGIYLRVKIFLILVHGEKATFIIVCKLFFLSEHKLNCLEKSIHCIISTLYSFPFIQIQ